MAESVYDENLPGDWDSEPALTSGIATNRKRKAEVSGIDSHITGLASSPPKHSRRNSQGDLDDGYDERNSYKRGLAVSCVLSQDYERARSLLMDIMGRQTDIDLDCMLLLLECHLYLSGGREGVPSLEFHLSITTHLSSAEILEWSDRLDVRGRRLGSIILLDIFKDIYNLGLSNTEYSRLLGDLAYAAGIRGSYVAVNGGTMGKEVAKGYVEQVILDLREKFQYLEDIDETILTKAKCNLGMGIFCFKIDEISEAIQEMESGKAELEKLEKMDSTKFTYYFAVLKVLWKSYFKNGNIRRTIEVSELGKCFLEEHGIKFMEEKDFKDALTEVRKNLRIARQKYNEQEQKPTTPLS